MGVARELCFRALQSNRGQLRVFSMLCWWMNESRLNFALFVGLCDHLFNVGSSFIARVRCKQLFPIRVCAHVVLLSSPLHQAEIEKGVWIGRFVGEGLIESGNRFIGVSH